MRAPYLSLHDVGVRFKLSGRAKQLSHFEPLRGVSLDVRPGETLGVLGMNGAGKSTLLKIMSGALKPDSGHVVNHGASVALLSLQAGFDRNLTGRDNAIFGGMLLGCSKRHILTRLDEIQDYSELSDYFNEPVRTYSSGMAARLGFAISITVSPDVLLVDEVLSVGDAHFKQKAERTMMQKIVSGQTVVLVSHSRAQIENLCDRCVLLHDGRIIESASVSDVLMLYDELIKQR